MARSRPASIPPGSPSSRRARRAMAISRPMRPWCWPSPPAWRPALLAEKLAERLASCADVTGVEIAGPGLHQSAAGRQLLAGADRRCARRRHGLRILEGRGGAAGQCGICLGQSDRAAAHRPCPGRRLWRCAGPAPDQGRLRGHPRILHQRCRRPGRYPRALGASALSRGSRRDHRRDSRGLLSRGLSEGRRPGPGGARRRQMARARPRANGWRRCAASPST